MQKRQPILLIIGDVILLFVIRHFARIKIPHGIIGSHFVSLYLCARLPIREDSKNFFSLSWICAKRLAFSKAGTQMTSPNLSPANEASTTSSGFITIPAGKRLVSAPTCE